MVKYISILLLGIWIAGCAGSKSSKKEVQEPGFTPNREKALEHFINGSIYDQKNDYASAILEYQDALRYDRDPAIYYAISRDYSLLRKHSLAAQSARQAIVIEPKNIKYRENLAEIFLNAVEFDSATAAYESIIRLDSSNYSAWSNTARLYQLKTPLKALEIYKKIIDRFGPSWEVLVQVAELYRMTGKLDDAINALKGALDIEPGNVDLRKVLAGLYMTTSKSDSALAIYIDIVETLPTDVESRASLAHLYLIRQDYENAAKQLEFVLKGDVLSIELQLRFGQIFLASLQTDSAVAPYALKLFDQIQKQYPDDWRPYWFLGVVNAIMKSDSVAVWNLRKVTELDRKNSNAWVYLASIYFDGRKYAEAIEILEEAQRYVTDEPRLFLILGIAYQRLGELEKAAITLEGAFQIDPQNIDVLSALALVYDDLKRYNESDSLYEKALRLHPDNHLLLNNYAYSLSVRNLQIDRALKMAKEAVRQQPQNPSYLDTIGWVYFQIGDYKQAEEFIKQAIDKGEASAVVHEHLGDVYYMLNDITKVMEYWQKALNLDPKNESLKDKIKRGNL
jgi:tetratricopeptide (TPR) repeat protein